MEAWRLSAVRLGADRRVKIRYTAVATCVWRQQIDGNVQPIQSR